MDFLLRHSYLLLFGVVLVGHLGFPVPSAPAVIAAGGLARSGQMSLTAALILATAASVLANWAWYEAGKLGGNRVLKLICRFSLEPDACVRRTENLFSRYGLKALLAAPFVPGLGTVAPPLAGMLRIPLTRFLAYDTLGAALWALIFGAFGYAFEKELGALVGVLLRASGGMVAAVAILLVAFLGWKLTRRYFLLRSLQLARIPPEELRRKLDSGEPITVVDLRHAMDVAANGWKIPGAIHVPAEELESRHQEIPRQGEVVLYCS